MKRSNRLILLIGIVLAIVAFVAVVLVLQGNSTSGGPTAPAQLTTVYATTDIPFGATVAASQVTTQSKTADQRAADAIGDVGLVVGRTITTTVKAGAQLREADFALSRAGQTAISDNIEAGLRAVAVQVDQISGVGTLINVGDHVDLFGEFTGDKFPVLAVDPTTKLPAPVAGLNNTSIKLLLQNMLVVGTLLPATTDQAATPGASAAPTTALTGQKEIVIVAATPQQAEVIEFVKLDGANNGMVTLALRSPKDFKDANGKPVVPVPDKTTGVILKTLVDQYGVLPPQIVETTLPKTP